MNENNAARPLPKRRKDARPGELLDAALDVFALTGYHAATMEEIGARAGVSKGTVYLYFNTKERLFAEAVNHGTEAILEKIESVTVESHGVTFEGLHQFVSTWAALAADRSNGAVLKLLLTESSALPSVTQCAKKLFERLHGVVESFIEHGAGDGEFRQCNSIVVTKFILAGLCWHGLGRGSTVLVSGVAQNDLYLHIDLVLHGLANRANSTSPKQ